MAKQAVNKIRIQRLTEDAILPKKAFENDACFDVVATSVKDLGDGRIMYGTGLAMELPEGTQLDIRARSSIHKTGLILSNGVGTGDEGYRGEYGVIFYNIIKELPNYEVGDRIAQIQSVNRVNTEFEEVKSLDDSERGEGGWGSTGK